MSYLIEDNNFTKDSYGVRATRLYFLSNTIDTYAVELALTGSLLTWAQGASAAFDAARVKQSVEAGEKEEAFQTSQESINLLAERYQILKDIVISRYPNDDNKLNIYGVDTPSPRTQSDVIFRSEQLIGGNTKLKTALDPNVLPDAMITNFQSLLDEAKNNALDATVEREEALKATEDLNNLYAADSKKLRALYNWIIATWSKFDTRLIALGYVQASDLTGGNVPLAPMGLSYSNSEHKLIWNPSDTATSYQIVYKASGTNNDFEEVYNGDMTEVIFTPAAGAWTFKIRARNANGYSDWSLNLEVNIAVVPAP